MANQGNQGNQNTGTKGNRDREGNLGQTGNDISNPAGTTGRGNDKGNENWQKGNEPNRPGSNPQGDIDREDDDSGIGNRSTNR
jgi:hypothetical protein